MSTAVVTLRFRLRELLEERETRDEPMTQSELARQSGVSLSIVNAIAQNRQRRVDLATLEALSRTLGVHPGELLTDDED